MVKDKFTAIVVVKDKLNPEHLLPTSSSSEEGEKMKKDHKKTRKEFKVKIDQSFLETVVPDVGDEVMILNGKHRGKKATVKSINDNAKCAALRTIDGEKINVSVAFEDFSQIYVS